MPENQSKSTTKKILEENSKFKAQKMLAKNSKSKAQKILAENSKSNVQKILAENSKSKAQKILAENSKSKTQKKLAENSKSKAQKILAEYSKSTQWQAKHSKVVHTVFCLVFLKIIPIIEPVKHSISIVFASNSQTEPVINKIVVSETFYYRPLLSHNQKFDRCFISGEI